MVERVQVNSSAKEKLFPGDVILSITFANGGDSVDDPTVSEVRKRLEKAGQTEQTVDFRVLRDEKPVDVKGLVPNVHLGRDLRG
jgi:C-terminal processing protease CtpA/Prc